VITACEPRVTALLRRLASVGLSLVTTSLRSADDIIREIETIAMFRIPARYAAIGFLLLGAGTAHSDAWTVNVKNPGELHAIKVWVKDALNKCKLVADAKRLNKKESTSVPVVAQKGAGKDDATATATHLYWKATQIAATDITTGSDNKSWCSDNYLYRNGATLELPLDPTKANNTCNLQCK
jgi:hypothetical protein